MIKKKIFVFLILSSGLLPSDKIKTLFTNTKFKLSKKTHLVNHNNNTDNNYCDNDNRHDILKFVSNQTKTKYFVPISTVTFFTASLFFPLLFAEHSKEGLKNACKQLENSFHALSKKDLALQLLKSLYVASTVSSNDFVIELNKKRLISLQKLTFLTLTGCYTWQTLTNSDDLTLNPALLEKLAETYAPLFTVESLTKAMHYTNKPVIKAEEIFLTHNNDKNRIANVAFYALFVLGWERLIKKSPLNRDFLKKMIDESCSLWALSITNHSQSNRKSIILQTYVWSMFLTSIYKASTGNTGLPQLENVLPATPSLEEITGLIAKDFFVPTIIYNKVLEAFNKYILDEHKNEISSRLLDSESPSILGEAENDRLPHHHLGLSAQSYF